MKIAELFVNLGIKGDGSASKILKQVRKDLDEVKSTGFATKAAMLAVFYGLEQMTTSAGARGQSLLQFSAATGKSTVDLQKMQYALMSLGVTNEEVEGSFRGITDAIAKMRLGGGAPMGLGMLMGATGLTDADLDRPMKVIQAIQKYAQSGGDPAIIKQLTSWAVGDNMFAGLRRFKGDFSSVGMSHIISEKEQEQLARVDAAWSHIWNTLKMIGVHLTSQHGLFAVDELGKSIQFLERLVNTMEKVLGKGTKMVALFGLIGVALYAALGPIGPIVAGLGLLFAELEKVAEGKDNAFAKIGRWLDSKGLSTDKVKDISEYGGGDPMKAFRGGGVPAFQVPSKNLPASPSLKGDARFEPKIETHIHTDSKDPVSHGKIAGREIEAAARTMQSLTQTA